ncbi:MAG TPA: energy transducer TonB [Pyrinomonadaceae bacterium]|nr:energy transducer TonB [Pyrinomonadaceae bacterium]
MKTIGLTLILCVVFCVSNLNAQKQSPNKSKKPSTAMKPSICGGGVLNLKEVSLPKPAFPKEAENTDAAGSVIVQVKLDEEGNVIETKVCSGHHLLRESAVEAAQQAKFQPTFLSDIPVKVSGIIIYRFSNKTSNKHPVNETSNDEVVVLSCPPGMNILKILNFYAINLVKPEFPPELRERNLRGAVNVQVTIDEKGKVISASAVSGHKELRKYAEEAVVKSTFKRFVRCGKPIQLTSIIVYNFIPTE